MPAAAARARRRSPPRDLAEVEIAVAIGGAVQRGMGDLGVLQQQPADEQVADGEQEGTEESPTR